jgi:hypothetical protein
MGTTSIVRTPPSSTAETTRGVARAVCGAGLHILDLLRSLGSYDFGESRMRSRVDQSVQAGLGIVRRRIVHRDGTKGVALAKVQIAKLGAAKAHGFLKQGRKHRLEIAGRAGDDLQHFRCRGLLLQRFGEIVSALTQLGEQSRILDGDDGLVGENGDQFGLLVGKWVWLSAGKREDTDRRSVAQEWHGEGTSMSCQFLSARRSVFGIGQHVRNTDCPAF